jgi:hypothetical protein
LAGLATAQHGVVARRQLLDAGLTKEAVARRIRAGRLHIVHRGVYAVGHPVLTREGRWMAAALATGGALSHVTAAAAWDWLPVGATIHVTVRGDPGRRQRRSIRVHRSTTLDTSDLTSHRRIPITSPIRTLLDVATTLNGRRLEQVFDRAETMIDFGALQRRLEAHPHQPGSASLRAVLSIYTVGGASTRSELEEAFLRLCDDHGLPRPDVNTVIEGMEVDFVWRDARLVVEVDGYGFHKSRRQFGTDRERDVRLTLAGWHVLRFAEEHVTHRPAWVAAAVRERLAHLGRIPTPMRQPGG